MAERVGLDMETRSPVDAIAWQAEHCRRNQAPITARVLQAMLPVLASNTRCGQRMANWPGLTAEDAMPLRLAGGFHNLHLTGSDGRLGPIYAGEVVDQDRIDAILLDVVRDHEDRLLTWLDGPPQTNEAGRSASLMAGFLWLSERLGPRFEINEIGASAGINTMMERYAFDLGGVRGGAQSSPMQIVPEWQGPPPPDAVVEVASIRGCDINPIDLTDDEAATRLRSYVWPENQRRMERLDIAIDLAKTKRPDVLRADAADWVEARLAEPQQAGVARALIHSIVWQYVAPEGRARIEKAMEAAGSVATRQRPLAWIMLETNRQSFRHELRVRYWPGGANWALLGEAHAHGAWVKWLGAS